MSAELKSLPSPESGNCCGVEQGWRVLEIEFKLCQQRNSFRTNRLRQTGLILVFGGELTSRLSPRRYCFAWNRIR